MKLTLEKKGIRVLGIAESFRKGLGEIASLAGIVMRGDFIIDGVVLGGCTVGGLDSTENVIKMYKSLKRDDVMAIMLNGCIISWFNVVDLEEIHRETGIPVIAVSYNPTKGIKEFFIKYFPDDWETRVEIYERNGPRFEMLNKNGFRVYVRSMGMGQEDAAKLVDRFTIFGKVPEPLRIARLIAYASMMHHLSGRSG
ncbi:MAG: DUF99 family protein [Nitrososphaeria archaeon]|nr:DUF99 family protein [Nitrososphaeria archaeon]